MRGYKFILNSKLIISIFIITILFSFSAYQAFAGSFSENQDLSSLDSDKTLEGPGFFSDDTVNIDGTVNGTTFASGSEVNVNGIINGDLFVAGKNIYIKGKVNGSVFAAGQNIEIEGEIENNIYSAGSFLNLSSKNMGDVFLAGQNISISDQASIERDLFTGSSKIFSGGNIGRNFFGSAENMIINGSVGKNANISAGNLKLEDSAQINGDLYYRSDNQADISSESSIAGNTEWKRADPEPKKAIISFGVFNRIFFSMISALLIWLIVKLFKPDLWPDLAANIAISPVRTSGIGALTLIVTPVIAIILMISIIAIPLGAILGILYGISIYLSTIISSVFIGYIISKRFDWTEIHKGIWIFLLGLLIIYILELIPFVGFLVRFIVAAAGIGALVTGISKLREDKKEIYTEI